MSTFQRFADIEAWQKARELTCEIVYRVSNSGSFSKDFRPAQPNPKRQCFRYVQHRRGL